MPTSSGSLDGVMYGLRKVGAAALATATPRAGCQGVLGMTVSTGIGLSRRPWTRLAIRVMAAPMRGVSRSSMRATGQTHVVGAQGGGSRRTKPGPWSVRKRAERVEQAPRTPAEAVVSWLLI